MQDIKLGDVVCLNSETNLPMTVVYVDYDSNELQCVYFNTQSFEFTRTPELPIESVTKERY